MHYQKDYALVVIQWKEAHLSPKSDLEWAAVFLVGY